jgi:hypothetical protein
MALVLSTVSSCLLHNLLRMKAYSELPEHLLSACHINKRDILFCLFHDTV